LIHLEEAWKGTQNISIYHQRWEPDAAAKAVVCLVHGLGEHSGRYSRLTQCLNENRYSVMACDLPGHGKSGGPRGHVDTFEEFMQTIDLLLEKARSLHPQQPCFLYGHSLGGILVLAYVLQRKPALSGVIVTSPGLSNALEQQKLKVALSKILGNLVPKLTLDTGLDSAMISRDPDVVRAYQADPLVHSKASTAMAKNTFAVIPWIFQHAAEFSLPLLVMHGGKDELAYPTGSERFCQAVSGDCTYKRWEGMAHELHNEPEKEDVFAYLLSWLDLRAV